MLNFFKVDYSLTFFGMHPDSTKFAITTEALVRVDFKSCLRNEDITPTVSLNKLQQTLRYYFKSLFCNVQVLLLLNYLY